MAAFCSGFVDADTTQVCQIETRQRGLDVVDDDAPQAGVVDAHEARGGGDGHMGDERHGHRLEQQREARARPRPRHVDERTPQPGHLMRGMRACR